MEPQAYLSGLGWAGLGVVLKGRPSASLSSAEDSALYLMGQAWEAEPDGPVRCITDPVREAVLIKFGSIIAGFVLWSHYGFFNLVNLSSPSPNPPLPPTTTSCDLRTILGIFSYPSVAAFSCSPDGIWRQDGGGRKEARIEDVMWQRRPQGLSV